MSEGKFSCPHCGQHIACEEGYIGRQIKCPACQGELVVPAFGVVARTTSPSGGVRLPASVSRLSAPPQPDPAPPALEPVQSDKNPLAVVSLSLSIASLIIGPLGFVPGIICGHVAKAKIKRNPVLSGAGLAKAGLIVGYTFLVLSIAVVGAFLVLVGTAVQITQQMQLQMRTNTLQSAQPSGATTDVVASSTQLLSGKIHGQDFKCDTAILSGDILTLREGQEFFADRQLLIFLFAGNQGVEGRTFTVSPGSRTGMAPQLQVSWKDPNAKGNLPKTEAQRSTYQMKIEFGQKANGIIPGKIHLEIPGEFPTAVDGSFEATIRDSASPTPPQNQFRPSAQPRPSVQPQPQNQPQPAPGQGRRGGRRAG